MEIERGDRKNSNSLTKNHPIDLKMIKFSFKFVFNEFPQA
jgi:hypothetical protein